MRTDHDGRSIARSTRLGEVLEMLHKGLFILAHECGDPSFFQTYRRLVRDQWKSPSELKLDQEGHLREMIRFVYEHVPYYHTLFKSLGLKPDGIRTIEDLRKLPILTKDTIKQHWEEFKPIGLSSMKYSTPATGGTTGTPFEYRLSRHDRFLGGALLYRGWGYGGFELGDRMVFLAGSSLDVGTRKGPMTKAMEVARNIKKLSSFDMGDGEMSAYARVINSFKPQFIRGYPSSIYFFARWLGQNRTLFHCPKAVFTTAEKLLPHMRKTIEDIFGCQVYDNYGLNDGGISAYECSEHNGLHIDTERSILEVVDGQNERIESGGGRILATSLYNYAMPFIRYDCGDEGSIGGERCVCGRGYPLLKEIVGRSTDILFTPDGKNIHGWFFLYIFWEHGQGIKEYQVVQEAVDRVVINIVPDDDFDEGLLNNIRNIVKMRSPGWNLEFRLVERIERTGAGKYKFIINKVLR